MEMDKKIAFAKLWRGLLILYDVPERADRLPVYWKVLKKYSYELIQQAVWQHIHDPKRGQFFPKPVELMSQIFRAQAEDAWRQVQTAIARGGMYEAVAFDDPIIRQVITELGGWRTLCCTPQREFGYVAQRFVQYYQQIPHRVLDKTQKLPDVANVQPALLHDKQLTPGVSDGDHSIDGAEHAKKEVDQ